MKYPILTFLTFLFFQYSINSQNKNIDEITNKIINYFELDHETIFTQVNKTKFIKGEEVWFKTYIYNVKEQLPYMSSTNLYASIYNDTGKLVAKKIFLVKNGMTHGNFLIDSTYSSGTYYFKTSTNWMKNFHEDYSHLQKIKVLGEAEKQYNNKTSNIEYDFQLLPEGGYIIADTNNTIGFKLIDSNGDSHKFDNGKILDSQGNLIISFVSNKFGLGKFHFNPVNGNHYSYELTLENGNIIRKQITGIKSLGVNIQLDNIQKEELIVRINTNTKTLKNLIDKSYYLVINRDGLLNKIAIDFKENQSIYKYEIGRHYLNSGINIITLINDKGRPIAERLIFNHNRTKIRNIEISDLSLENDSLLVKLKTNTLSKVNLSVSALPSSTEAHERSTTIISSFLINPYLKGTIENPWYYFESIDNERIYNLDLLLLTQGWSRYSWDNIFNYPAKINYNFETGFTIKGKLNNYSYKSGDIILLQSFVNLLEEEYKLDDNKLFSFDNLYLKEGSPVFFTLKDRKGNKTKPNVYFNIYPIPTIDKIKVKEAIYFDTTWTQKNNYDDFIFDNTTVLDSVTISVNSIKPKNKPRISLSNSKHISFANDRNFARLIIDVIRQNGFNVAGHGQNVSITSRRVMNLSGSLPPRVFLDNMEISNQLDLIASLRVGEVEEMFVSHNSNLYASAGGVIHIFTKTDFGRSPKKTFSGSKIDFGFTIPKDYYSPFYNKFDSENYRKVGVLNWIPNLTKNKRGELSFKLPKYYNDDIQLYIEGMDENGGLFSTIIRLPVNK